jgi:hypothetical protein
MLQAGRVGAVTFEVMFASMYEGQATLEDALRLLRQTPYKLLGFYEQTYINNKLTYINACFICDRIQQ